MSKELTEAKKKAIRKYEKEKLESISFKVKKGKREEYNTKAAAMGMSLRGLIINYLESL